MVPLRKIAVAFGYTIAWDGKSATIADTAATFILTPGVGNSGVKKLEIPPEIKDSKLFVPISFIQNDCGISYTVNADDSITFTK